MKKSFSILTLLVGLIAGCDLWTTRSPEDPSNSTSNFVPASDPETLFQNLKSALQDGIVENYIACFVDVSYLKKEFVFIPASGTIIENPRLSSWNLQAEKEYFNELISKLKSGSSITFNYTIAQKDYNSEYYEYVIDYAISFQSSSLSGEYQGTSRFKIYVDSRGQCVIVEWEDIKKNDYDCWSELKGRTY